MDLQLSFFETETKKKRMYNRVSDGRFATKEQSELERVRGEYVKPIYNWVAKDPILFDKPILNVKGRLNFWDFDYAEII